MRNFVLAFAIFITSSISFAGDLPLQLEPLTPRYLPVYKQLLRQFTKEDVDKGAIPEYSMAHLTAHETEIDELAALGLYEIPTLFTDWLICKGEYVIGLYSINIPAYEFLIDVNMLFTKSSPSVPVPVMEKFTYPATIFKAAATFEPGYTLASMRLLQGVNREGVKEAIEEILVKPYYGNEQYAPFFTGGRFYQTTTKHRFKGVVYK
ncbi:MAG: hypothetical protein K2Q34_04270 [Alphaproteobacteria bacterium]|nr:hypothetical protein [Alphaproteobacteria bacterium]